MTLRAAKKRNRAFLAVAVGMIGYGAAAEMMAIASSSETDKDGQMVAVIKNAGAAIRLARLHVGRSKDLRRRLRGVERSLRQIIAKVRR